MPATGPVRPPGAIAVAQTETWAKTLAFLRTTYVLFGISSKRGAVCSMPGLDVGPMDHTRLPSRDCHGAYASGSIASAETTPSSDTEEVQ